MVGDDAKKILVDWQLVLIKKLEKVKNMFSHNLHAQNIMDSTKLTDEDHSPVAFDLIRYIAFRI